MFTRDQQIDRRILYEADALEADGWSVSIFAVPRGDSTGPEDRRVIRIGGGEASAGWSSGTGPLLKAYRWLGRILPVNNRWIMALRAIALSLYRGGADAFVVKLFERAIAESVADVYVAHDLPMLPVAVAAVDRHGGRLVYDSHELFAEQELTSVERRLWRRLEARLIRRCDLVITINPSIARELEGRYGIGPVAVVHNAERVEQELPRGRRLHERLGLPEAARVLLYQGGLSEGRNLDTVVRMIPLLRSPALHVVFLGDGLLAGSLARLAANLGVSERIHLLPAVPQAKLLGFTTSADAGLIPYRANCLNTYYCTPNKLFEFIAAGVPIIATDLPELRRLVVDNGIGLVGDTDTPEALARLVDAMFEEPGGPGRFADALRAAGKRINWQVEGVKLIEMYRRLAPGRSSSGEGEGRPEVPR